MTRRTPSSTLFPYTTLFRSRVVLAAASRTFRRRPNFELGDRQRQGRTFLRFSDRKSTRLNSSHPSISYAVFCLKKKKDAYTRSRGHGSRRRARTQRLGDQAD